VTTQSSSERREEGLFSGPGWSALLREVAEGLRQERARLEQQVHWGVLAEAERAIAPGLAEEARRRLRDRVARQAAPRAVTAPAEEEVVRFSVLFRAQHMGLMVSTLTLIVTGLPLRYAETAWAHALVNFIGGVPVQAILHRSAAGLLIAVGVCHMIYITLTREGRSQLRALLPRPRDVGDLFHNLAHFVGLVRRGPRFDRFSYVEKFDYWAVYWGIVVMVGSGLMLWAPEISMRYLPKYAMDIAKLIHSDEALLAAVAIVIWHFYNVHFGPEHFPFNRAWLTGRVSAEKMRRHHPREYERLLRAQETPGHEGERPTG
jgi:formate dehydrogenase subunit gamma